LSVGSFFVGEALYNVFQRVQESHVKYQSASSRTRVSPRRRKAWTIRSQLRWSYNRPGAAIRMSQPARMFLSLLSSICHYRFLASSSSEWMPLCRSGLGGKMARDNIQ
jgi:hypothetical protein